MFWRKKHPVSREDLTAFVDGRPEAPSFASHIEGCEVCRRDVAELRAVKAMLSAMPEVQPRRSFALTPAMAGQAEQKPRPLPRRQPYSLGYLPALAMTVLVLLFAVDIAVIDTTSPDRAALTGANGAAELRTFDSAGAAPPSVQESVPRQAGTPAPGAGQTDEAAPMPAAAADRATTDEDAASERQAVAETRSDTTLRDTIRVLQLIAGLALIVSLFVWLRARLRVQ